MSSRRGCWLGLVLAGAGAMASGQDAQTTSQTIQTLVEHEAYASDHRGHYTYVSEERSDRTGGHLWRERVAETNWGKVKYLVEEDGKPLEGDRLAVERRRIEGEGADPEGFKRAESARMDDEQHAKQMLTLLPKAFLFDPPVEEGENERLAFKPNPAYSPANLEERVLHGMYGSVLIDKQTVRMRAIDMTMPQDVTLGFGFLATIHQGSNFHQTRDHQDGLDWKTAKLHTDFKGKALFLKTVARSQDSVHMEFRKLRDGMTVAEAVAMLEK
jgi:hypothetical protein